MTRISFIHTGAVVIPIIAELAATHLPGIEVHHLLDDKIVSDLRQDPEGSHVGSRLQGLGHAAVQAGSDAVMLTCSSISGHASALQAELGIPVLRIDEAMADAAVAGGGRVSVLATLSTTLAPTVDLLHERAAAAGSTITIDQEVIEGAFDAVTSGKREHHDELVGAAVLRHAGHSDVVVLAQASMASAASTVRSPVPVLSSPELGVRRAADVLRTLSG